jgi:hypothetical protein
VSQNIRGQPAKPWMNICACVMPLETAIKRQSICCESAMELIGKANRRTPSRITLIDTRASRPEPSGTLVRE